MTSRQRPTSWRVSSTVRGAGPHWRSTSSLRASRSCPSARSSAGSHPMSDELLDRVAIRELVEHWFVYRDNRDWEKFLTVWHEDGVMMTTWGGQTTPQGFADAAQRGYDQGDRMLHECGPTVVELRGDRAIAQSKLRIMQRGPVEGVECDVDCIGRVYDFVE